MARAAENTVATLTDQLLLAILHGRLPPGSRLPSVRALAQEHGVNVSTVQRVLARLEEAGVVVTRPRSGVVVLDPNRHGGAALWPLLLRHPERQRERAVRLLADALAARRLLALDVVRALVAVPFADYGAELRAAIDGFAQVVHAGGRDLRALAEAESEIIRTVLLSVERSAVLAIYNDIAALLLASQDVLAALYTEPEVQLTGWRMLIELLAAGSTRDGLAFVEPLLTARDERAVLAYAASLGLSEDGAARPRRPPASTRTRRRKA